MSCVEQRLLVQLELALCDYIDDTNSPPSDTFRVDLDYMMAFLDWLCVRSRDLYLKAIGPKHKSFAPVWCAVAAYVKERREYAKTKAILSVQNDRGVDCTSDAREELLSAMDDELARFDHENRERELVFDLEV